MSLLLLDIEIEPKSNNLLEVGIVVGEHQYRGIRPHEIEKLALEAKWVAGHNIYAHDLKFLREKMELPTLFRLPVIDTLSLSVLLQPDKEKHALDKDYFPVGLSSHNPLQDALLAGELLDDLGDAWWGIPENMRRAYRNLLDNVQEFSGFWEWLEWKYGKSEPIAVYDAALGSLMYAFGSKMCISQLPEEIGQRYPVEFAMVLSILQSANPAIKTPSWVLGRYPRIEEVYKKLRETPCSDPECNWCRTHLDPEAALGKYFGYAGFRKFEGDGEMPLQHQVVNAALKDESFLAIFPTGGGKSLTFQLPALMRGEASGKLTVVISPLVALMKDQVDVLKDRFQNVNAVTINGMLSPLERQEAIRLVEEGIAHILYVSPESLRSATVLRLLQRRIIDRFVIDEAHCFSAWGQDFRVDYGFIGKFIKKLQSLKLNQAPIPVSCFTATARPEVVEDIIEYFKKELDVRLQTFITRQGRINLNYRVILVKEKQDKFLKILRILEEVEGPVIIYVSRVKTTEELASKLNAAGFAAAPYNGRMEAGIKRQTQEDFKADKIRIIVATSAFGMGVDKDDVEMVIHYEIANSLENYLQEAGRAGRNPKLTARCIILFDKSDLDQHFLILQGSKISQKEIDQIWKAIKDFKREKISKSALELARKAGWDEEVRDLETRVRTAVNALEQAGYIERDLNAPRIFADSMLVESYSEAEKKIQANAFLFGDNLEKALRVMKAIMGKSRREGETRVDYLADLLGIHPGEMAHILNNLTECECLGDLKDISAEINLVNSPKGTDQVARKYVKLEARWANELVQGREEPFVKVVSLREENDRLENEGTVSSINYLRRILQSWEVKGWIKKEREDRSEFAYRIRFRKDPDAFLEFVKLRGAISLEIVEELISMARQESARGIREKNHVRLIEFSLIKLKEKLNSGLFQKNYSSLHLADALLFLDTADAIELKKGFLVFYTRLTIEKREQNNRKQFTKEDFEALKQFYRQKVEQIHIVGAYAGKMLENYEAALEFSNDYFRLSHEEFIAKYFPGRRDRQQLSQPLTKDKFEEIFGNLSTQQLEVVKDSQSQGILVAAGPGSGKTRVLVHKMASLIILEDVLPHQFLMLAFSRPAAREFRERLYGLIKGMSRGVDIHTYHGFAFRLLGRIGTLDKADNVIEMATQAILEGEIPLEKVASKMVIMLDEFQDISQQEWNFIQAICKVADQPRIIVAGDDDQSIYEFRGASADFMRRIGEGENARTYFLTGNFRSDRSILHFINQYLQFLPQDRIKKTQVLQPKKHALGSVKLIRYRHTKLLEPFCQAVGSRSGKGTVGVLTGTNIEAEFAASRLLQLGIPAVLIADRQDFPLRSLEELDWFSTEFLELVKLGDGMVAESDWKELMARFNQKYADSSNLKMAQRILAGFHEANKKKFRVDWLEFLRTLRLEDFYAPEAGKVLVSTMHKAKGKEFDQVFLLLDAHQFKRQESFRAAYVGLSRAKEYLEIHTHYSLFDKFSGEGIEVNWVESEFKGLETLKFTPSLEDVVLSHCLRSDVAQNGENLHAGAPLYFAKGVAFHRLLTPGNKKFVVSLSTQGTEKLNKYLKKGYDVHSAQVGFIVIWSEKETGKTGRVILPELELRKSD